MDILASEEILKQGERYCEELAVCVQNLRLPLSPPVPQPLFDLTSEIQELLALEEKAMGQLDSYQNFRLYKLLGRLCSIAVDYSLFAKTPEWLYKYLSQSMLYLCRAYQNPAVSSAESLSLRYEYGITAIRLVWTLMSSTDDPVERLAKNINWSGILSHPELYDMAREARELLGESLNDLELCNMAREAHELLGEYLDKRPEDWTASQYAQGWEHLALACRVFATTRDEHVSAAEAYLKAAAYHTEGRNLKASIQATSNAVIELGKASDWKRVLEISRTLFDTLDLAPELDDTPTMSLGDRWNLQATLASELAISLYHLNQPEKAQDILSTWVSPLIFSWALPMQRADSLEEGLQSARSAVFENALKLIKDEALASSDYTAQSFILSKLFENQAPPQKTSSSIGELFENQAPPQKTSSSIGSALLNTFRNISEAVYRKSSGKPKSTTRKQTALAQTQKSDTALVEIACGHGESVVFMTLSDGFRHSFVLPKLTMGAVQDKLVAFRGGKVENGWLASYLSYRETVDNANVRNSSTEQDTMRNSAFEQLDNLLLWLHEVFAEPLYLHLNELAKQANSTINHLILVPTTMLGFVPLHGAYSIQNTKRRYLVDEFSISYCPSSSLARHDQSPSDTSIATKKFLLSLRPTVPTLFMELDHLFAISGLTPDRQAVIQFNTTPSEGDWKKLASYVSQATHLLVSSHGIADLSRPLLNSGFFWGHGASTTQQYSLALALLKDLGSVRTQPRPDVSLLNLIRLPLSNCKFVFLGACESSMSSSLPRADSGMSPAIALLLAGAEQAVASMWLADDLVTTLICKGLFEGMANGLHGSLALRNTQQRLRTLTWGEIVDQLSSIGSPTTMAHLLNFDLENPETKATRPYEHPWFWAGYQSWVRHVI
jgi:CHAT domain-containing protein